MLSSVDDVIEALGGPSSMATLTGVGVSAVSNWRSRGIAADKFIIVTEALKSRGLAAAPNVFAFKIADEVRA